MPVIASRFDPPFYLRNGHVQTILAALLPRRLDIVYERERLELADGDFLDLDWMYAGQKRLVILSHGLEGSSANSAIRGMAAALLASGWDALAWNFRSCSGELNRLLRFYHSGETRDLASVIERAAARYARIALVGFSLGGNMTLKYLGESVPNPSVAAAAAISVPIDLASSARTLDRHWTNRIYLSRFLRSLLTKVEAKARRFPQDLDTRGIRSIRGFQEFDDRYTARVHGFRDAADYWDRSSARHYLRQVSVPTLLLNARDDPFLAAESFPFREAEQNTCLFLEAPVSGGHAGFLESYRNHGVWSERRIPEFLEAAMRSPADTRPRSA